MESHDFRLLLTLLTPYCALFLQQASATASTEDAACCIYGPARQVVDSDDTKNIFEWQSLAIKWHYNYPDDWERAVTYWRFFNETIEQAQAIILMLKDGSNPAMSSPLFKGKVEELDDYNGGILVKDIRMFQSGTYLIQMDFKDRVSYNNRTDVNVLKDNGTYSLNQGYDFFIGNKTFDASEKYTFTEKDPRCVGVFATDKMPPGNIHLTYGDQSHTCADVTCCSFHNKINLSEETLTATIKLDGMDVTALEMIIEQDPALQSPLVAAPQGSNDKDSLRPGLIFVIILLALLAPSLVILCVWFVMFDKEKREDIRSKCCSFCGPLLFCETKSNRGVNEQREDQRDESGTPIA